VLVERCEAFGSSDAGIYVGQTTNCIVRDSTAHDNVASIEIENSTNCEVYGNTAEHNTGGILVFELPGMILHGSGTAVHDNIIRDNNTPNFAAPGGIIGLLPVGTGMMVLAANELEIFDNTITGNDTVGIFVISYQTAILAGATDPMEPAYDMFSEEIYIHDNMITGNGDNPAVSVAGIAGLTPGVQTAVVWDGYIQEGMDVTTLCLGNTGEFRNIDAPNGFANPSEDPSPHACMTPVRPPVTL
jgi:parallel beta-helix repeat protein